VIFVLVHAAWVCGTAGLLFLAIKKTIGLRVSAEEELAGLDIEEHGTAGYGPELFTPGAAPVGTPVGVPVATPVEV
jgi:ammonium transporter, Amt family